MYKLVGGEVAERLNAAVSKTVMSVNPASGVRIPPSPRPTLFTASSFRPYFWMRTCSWMRMMAVVCGFDLRSVC